MRYNHFTIRLGKNDENCASELHQLLKSYYSSFIEAPGNKTRTGIYLATNTAGLRESVAFWKNVLEQTPAFANPANFPWTLANAPASFFAKILGVKGPVFTMVGKSEAMAYCFSRAANDISRQVIDNAWIIGYHEVAGRLSVGIFFTGGIADMKEIAHLATELRLPLNPPDNPDAVSTMQKIFASSLV